MPRTVRFKAEMINLRELKASFSAIGKMVAGEDQSLYRSAARSITEAYQVAGNAVRDRAKENAASGSIPRRLYVGTKSAIFSFVDFSATANSKRSRSALVGVRTGAPPRKDSHLYVEWGTRSGGKKGMSLARIFESGTRRGIKPRRYFRSAVFATRGKVISILTNAYESALARFK